MTFAVPPSPQSPNPRTGAGRLLVVDDDRLVLATLVHGLTQAGFDVIDADNGDDAILLAREHRPELALLDIRMDGMSGFDVAAYLRDHLQIPFMFLSAFSDEATLAQIRALGALAYLVKPLDVGQIVPVVRQAHAQALSGQRPGMGAGGPAPVSPGPVAGHEPRRAPPFAYASPAPVPAPARAPVVRSVDQVVPIAIGVLMHRYSLARGPALERLERLARQEGRTLEATCAAMVGAIEQLALPSDL